MASYLKPRRGAYSAISSTVLQSGEIFFETPNGVGGGKGRIMMGNASNTYAQLAGSSKYFLDIDSSPVAYSNITGSVGSSADNYSALAASLGSGTVTLPTLTRVLKRALYDLRATIAKLNSDISTVFYTGTSSSWRYYTFYNASYNQKIRLFTTTITGTYTTANTLQSFTSTIPSSIKPTSFAAVHANCFMQGEPNCWVHYCSYNNNTGVVEVYVKSSGASKATTIYVTIIGVI